MININTSSLMAHQKMMDINANNIANVNTQNFKPEDAHIEDNLKVNSHKGDKLELSKEITDQIAIENGFKAQVAPIKTENEMTKTLLDIKA